VAPAHDTPEQALALRLFSRSLLKQRKHAEISALLGPTTGLHCLDLGADNGVVSLLLRRAGGSWASADLTQEAVDAIRSLVGDDVCFFDGVRLPFDDACFERVVVIDMLEHVPDDAAFARELCRVTKPGGRLIVNTPHLKRTALRRLRHAIGETDEKHGHLRPGYTPADLERLLGAGFDLERQHTYSRFFSEAIDTAINWALARSGKQGSAKGTIVTPRDLERQKKKFFLYSLIYPIVWAVSRLDALVPAPGYMLIARLIRR
jgi:ubiquinone/menaquinone biosynthesis C-methylase UbiE